MSIDSVIAGLPPTTQELLNCLSGDWGRVRKHQPGLPNLPSSYYEFRSPAKGVGGLELRLTDEGLLAQEAYRKLRAMASVRTR